MLATRQSPFVFVLDDVHVLVSPEALDVIAVLVAELPLGSTLALVGRARPRLRFGRLRVKPGLVELGVEDLALDETGAATALAGLGVEIGSEDVRRLVERTEGWPAGLHLAARSLPRTGDIRRAVAEFTGDSLLVADYLQEEFLRDLAPDVLSFLLEASCLPCLSGPLCDAASSGATRRRCSQPWSGPTCW